LIVLTVILGNFSGSKCFSVLLLGGCVVPNFPVLAIPGHEAFMQDLMAAALEVLNRDSDDDDYITDMLPAVPKHVVPYIPSFRHQNAAPKTLDECSITLPEVPDDPPVLVCVREKNEQAAAGASEAEDLESSSECNLSDELAARQEKKTKLTDAILELRLECLKLSHTWDTCLPRVDIDSETAREVIDYAMAMRCGTVKESPVAYYTAQLKKQVGTINVQSARDRGRRAVNRQPEAGPTPKLLNNASICVDLMKALELAKDATAIYDPDRMSLEDDVRLKEIINTYETYQKLKEQLAGLQAALQVIDDICK
ncbi:hypothetical protein, partial [Endozoicomonas sp. SESOKO3]|uniref:hypothetical protein n=1 Tax=Endozoicomonas sp. SESOKO3 TaxID=2828744 RepID=UPI0021491D41